MNNGIHAAPGARKTSLAMLALAMCAITSAPSTAIAQSDAPKHRSEVVAQSPAGSFFENIALGPDGAFYITDYPLKRVMRYSAKDGMSTFAELEHYPLGIVFDSDGSMFLSTQEISIVGGSSGAPGKNVIYRGDKGEKPLPFKVADEAGFLNGWTRLAPGRLLVADSKGGIIWEVNAKTGAMSKYLSDPLLDTNNPAAPTPGANGIKLNGGYLYVSNTARATFVRAKLDNTGKPGAPEVYLENARADDFDFSPKGTLYFTTHRDKVFRVIGGKVEEFSSDPAILGSTAVIWDANGKGPFVLADGGLIASKWYQGKPPGPATLTRFDVQE